MANDATTDNRLILDLTLAVAYAEDLDGGNSVLPDFDDQRIVIQSQADRLDIIFDGIGAFGTTAPDAAAVPFIDGFVLSERKGLYLSPEVFYTDSGRELRSATLSCSGRDLFYEFLEIDRSRVSELRLRFAVQRNGDSHEANVTSTVVVNLTDLDLSAADLHTAGGAGNDRWAGLAAAAKDAFVTVYYPLAHREPSNALALIRPRLSLLGKADTDDGRQALVITDRSDYVRSLVQLLDAADKPVPQVLIEVRILEVTWREEERIGFNWAISGTNSQDGRLDLELGAEQSPDVLAGSTANLLIGKLTDEGLRLLQAQLDLLQREGRVSLLANPKLQVVNNQSARFHSGLRVPIARRRDIRVNTSKSEVDAYVDVDADPNTPDELQRTATRSSSRNLIHDEDFIDIGVTLEATPRIGNDGEVVLDLAPRVAELARLDPETNVPVTMTREVTTTVRLAAGQTVFIGGLFKEGESQRRSSVIGLGRVPVVGRLFRNRQSVNDKTEVVFLVRIAQIM